MTEFDDRQLTHFWDALAAGQPVESELDPSLTDPLRQVHALFHAPKPGSARERARQRLIDSTQPKEEHHMSASAVPIGFPSTNGYAPSTAISSSPRARSKRHQPPWTFAALAAILVLLLGGIGAYFSVHGQQSQPSVPAVIQAPEMTPTLIWSTGGDESSPLERPQAVEIAPDGTGWVANSTRNVFEVFSPDGSFIGTWGTAGQFALSNRLGGALGGIGWDANGNSYIFDSYNSRVQKFDPDGQLLLTWGSPGLNDGQMYQPLGAVDPENERVYVTGATQRVDVYNLEGNLIDQFGGVGNDPGEFISPYGIAVDTEGNVYVADKGNARIQVFDKFGNLLTDRGDGGVLATGVGEVYYMDIDSSGNIYAADFQHGRLLIFDPSGALLLEIDQIDGLPGLEQLTGVAVDAVGNVWLTSDTHNYLAKIEVALPA